MMFSYPIYNTNKNIFLNLCLFRIYILLSLCHKLAELTVLVWHLDGSRKYVLHQNTPHFICLLNIFHSAIREKC